ncbi:MAG TPA: single-stranded DNA-binding protein [Patescibacteria group bacterium]|nr:single-stranded DNA-binding protein [Patescibacteria group bacterium]
MSSRSLNKVTLIGNLTRDPELRYTPTGAAVCTIGLATNRSWVTDSGEKKEETEFHRVVAWNKLAELCSQLLAKGRKVYVEGRLRTSAWQAQDGTQRTTTEIVIEDMILLDSKRPIVSEEGAPVAEANQAPPASAPQPSPGSSGKKKSEKKDEASQEVTPADAPADPSTSSGQENVNPDDIPF